MAGDEEVEAVARALMQRWIDQANAERYEGGPHTSPMVEPEEYDIDDPPEGMWEQALLDADAAIAVIEAECVPSPVSGTEPDTAKLVEALRELMAEAKAYLEPVGSYANPAMHQARAALAGLSVGAGKPEEER